MLWDFGTCLFFVVGFRGQLSLTSYKGDQTAHDCIEEPPQAILEPLAGGLGSRLSVRVLMVGSIHSWPLDLDLNKVKPPVTVSHAQIIMEPNVRP
jgi:hypothetical protein